MPRKLDPQIELLLRAGDFCAKPGPETHAALAAAAPAAGEVYEILAPLEQQLVAAAERSGRAPPAGWAIAVDGLSELLTAFPAAPAPAAASQPIPCPACGELSASPCRCDVCGEQIQAPTREAALGATRWPRCGRPTPSCSSGSRP